MTWKWKPLNSFPPQSCIWSVFYHSDRKQTRTDLLITVSPWQPLSLGWQVALFWEHGPQVPHLGMPPIPEEGVIHPISEEKGVTKPFRLQLSPLCTGRPKGTPLARQQTKGQGSRRCHPETGASIPGCHKAQSSTAKWQKKARIKLPSI